MKNILIVFILILMVGCASGNPGKIKMAKERPCETLRDIAIVAMHNNNVEWHPVRIDGSAAILYIDQENLELLMEKIGSLLDYIMCFEGQG
ncbi:hypothetical protein CL629_03445 [bacterium]|nr:hypothetical protein [bacterium]|tara:strand:- start:17690 stop:17962 length:273 start_codon:yes stop_codon:yes gene_type:complete